MTEWEKGASDFLKRQGAWVPESLQGGLRRLDSRRKEQTVLGENFHIDVAEMDQTERCTLCPF